MKAPTANLSLRAFKPNRETLMGLWTKATRLPGGKRLFSHFVGRAAPYTGTIGAQVEALEPGYAKCRLKDRPKIRNHLRSVHAIALANFVEETTGLAMVSAVPDGMRGIVTRVEIDYLKKARGILEAECHAPHVNEGTTQTYRVHTEVKNSDGHIVTRGTVHWQIGPA